MTKLVTHFFQHADKETALAQLAAYTDGQGNWRVDFVDPGIPITDTNGQLKPGYFTNVALSALDTTLPGLTGAGYYDTVAKTWVTVWGTQPAGAPQRMFVP